MEEVAVSNRWEWRTFAPSLAGLEARIGAVAKVQPRETDEIYFLGSRDDLNLKARKGTLDLKVLDETDEKGLQLWKPAGKIEFPAPADGLRYLLAPFGFSPAFHGPTTLETFLKRMAAGGELQAVRVRKSRRNFEFQGCLAEFAGITANGQTQQSFCIESESREKLLAALVGLGLSPGDNVSFPQGLKRDFNVSAGAEASAKASNVEIERKFLVDMNVWKPAEDGVPFRQGYLSSEKERVVRVRVAGTKGLVTVKGATVGNTRSEFEYEIPVDEASSMLESLCERPIIEKTRYRQSFAGKMWEIDVFHGDNDGLVVAEVELQSASEAFEKPPWATREVSELPRYFNNNLIAHPYKTWSASDRDLGAPTSTSDDQAAAANSTGSSHLAAAASQPSDKIPFDPLDMRNYGLEKLQEIKAGPWMARAKLIGVPLAILAFMFFHFQWSGKIAIFEHQTKIKNVAQLYSATGIFVFSLILWLTESIPSYLTGFIVIVAVVLLDILPMRTAFAYLGEPVMILNIASFVMASALVVTGLAKRISLLLVLKWGNHLNGIFWAFIVLNSVSGAFISATSAKTALLLPMFMVISAMYGAFGGTLRNNVGRNLVLQNLLANNVSASAFITGSAANLLAAQLMEKAGAKVFYSQWLMAMLPLAILQCAIAWYSGVKWILPISKEESKPHLEGGMDRLRHELTALGPVTSEEIRAALVFLTVLGLWATDSIHGIKAEIIAVAGCAAVLLPAFSGLKRFGVINWNQADIPWHMLMFSWGAYVLGGMMEKTAIVDLTVFKFFETWGITAATPKVMVFTVMATLFGLTTLVSESKTARTIIMFPIVIATATKFGWDVVGFCLPMTFLINQVYVFYFNSKPANISYLTNQYSTWDGFKFGMIQLLIIIALLIPWTHYVMPLMGFKSRLW